MTADTELMLSLSGISYSYRALPVLNTIDWEWHSGEQWALLGPNGAGKTTLARLLSRQLTHPSGDIIRGPQLQAAGTAYVCFEQQKAMCDRDNKLDDSEQRPDANDPGTTVQQAICGYREPDAQTREWIARLGIGHILDRGIRFISTGEMRKTLLLQAILKRPALLILDSPLDGLDRASQQEMAEILEQLLASPLNVLLLYRSAADLPAGITHIMALDAGRIIASGSRNTVLQDEAVHSLMHPPRPELGQLPAAAERDYALSELVPLLELRDVSVSYDDNTVLDRVHWTFRRGQNCCISGPNGCGKTTLLSLINGDNHKAYGQDITLFGIPRGSGESVWDIKRKFGLLNTQLHLKQVRGMRVLEVVISGFFDSIGLYDNWGDQQRQIALQWLAALGMESIALTPFDTLSFGMQRMVLLARAMVKSPIILILDEPCLGLDAAHTDIILRATDHIADQSDTQVLFVSHSIGEVPDCINQWLDFVPAESGFDLRCREDSAAG